MFSYWGILFAGKYLIRAVFDIIYILWDFIVDDRNIEMLWANEPEFSILSSDIYLERNSKHQLKQDMQRGNIQVI